MVWTYNIFWWCPTTAMYYFGASRHKHTGTQLMKAYINSGNVVILLFGSVVNIPYWSLNLRLELQWICFMKFKTNVCQGMVTVLMWSPIYQNPSRIMTAKISFSLNDVNSLKSVGLSFRTIILSILRLLWGCCPVESIQTGLNLRSM